MNQQHTRRATLACAAAGIAIASILSGPAVQAQDKSAADAKTAPAAPSAPASAPAAPNADDDAADGEIRKVDADTGKLTIRHGPIRSVEMPAMTMVFPVRDPALLNGLKSGDKIRFKVQKTVNGIVVTEVQRQP